jgi:hypothetical protein
MAALSGDGCLDFSQEARLTLLAGGVLLDVPALARLHELLPAYVSSYTKAAIWCRRDPQGRPAVLLLNASADPLASVFLHLRNAQRLEMTRVTGQTQVLAKTGLDGPYSIFSIPGPGPWEPVLLTIN